MHLNTLLIGLIFTAALPAWAADPKPHEEPFESLDGVVAYRGYRAVDAELKLVETGAQEGKKCVHVNWTAEPSYPGNGGVEKTIPPTDFTGKTFSVWFKPVTPDTVGTAFVSFEDAAGKRAEMRAWHHITGWKNLQITVGAKGGAGHYEYDPEADLTKITTIRFYAITKEGGQKAEALWDGFQEVKD